MTIREKIGLIFPSEDRIPREWALDGPIGCGDFLMGGRLLKWEGPMCEVASPVWSAGPSGPLPRIIGTHPLLTSAESLSALDAAVAAYGNGRGEWPCMAVGRRIEHVRRFTARLEEKRVEIIKLLMWETGKNLSESVREFDQTIEYIAHSVDALKENTVYPEALQEGPLLARVEPRPLGVALCLGPYNFPLNETLMMVIPALLVGNTVVFKPPRFGALLYGCLLPAFRDCFPPGVVNIIWGDGEITDALMSTGRIDILGFVGSSQAADRLSGLHPQRRRLHSIMGLEAKNPGIVLADADIELAARECAEGSLKFNGQRCTALKILLVHESRVSQFLRELVRYVQGLGFGMPWDQHAYLTPLPDRDRIAYLRELVEDAMCFGASIVNEAGGTIHGSFFYPAIVYPVNSKMRLYREEQFGPVVPVVPFSRNEEVLDHVAGSEYGQQLSLFSSGKEAAGLLDDLKNQVCRININRYCQRGPDVLPFAARKASGIGIRSINETLRTFSLPTVVAADEADPLAVSHLSEE